MQARAEARAGAPGLLPCMRSSSSSKPTQDPRPLIAGATAHITGPPAKTAADILVEEGGYPDESLRTNDEIVHAMRALRSDLGVDTLM